METDSDSILFYIDELKSEDINTRLHAINSLDLIAGAIGVEKTRSELIPFTNELVEDDNEEVLIALAAKLSELVPLIGGETFVSCLFPPLTALCSNEEPFVRNKATSSITLICDQMTAENKVLTLKPIIESLASSSWCSAKISACSLTLYTFPQIPQTQQDSAIDLFIKLACDESPNVRKAASQILPDLWQSFPCDKLVRIFRNLIEDDNDCVRQITLKSADLLSEKTELLVIIQKFASDKSWKIRYSVIENIEKLIGKIEGFSDVIKDLLGLLRDPESEVRALAVSKLPYILNKTPASVIISEIIVLFQSLSQDISFHVRLALMESLCKVTKYVDSSICIQKVLPIINNLIRDENFEVRMKFAENFNYFNEGIGINSVIRFSIPINMQMMNDPRWRIRLKVVESLPNLAEILGMNVFTEQLAAPLMKWVEDPVFGVREAAIQSIFAIANNFGKEWTKKYIYPLIEMLASSSVFTKRMTALKGINILSDLFEYQAVCKFLVILANDKVPNIRFNVAKTVKRVMDVFKIGNELIKVIEKLRVDSDSDVRFYANQVYDHIIKIKI